MKLSEGGRGVVLLKEWTTHNLSRGLNSDQTKLADAHFPVLVVELRSFLSISVCWFWFQLS